MTVSRKNRLVNTVLRPTALEEVKHSVLRSGNTEINFKGEEYGSTRYIEFLAILPL